MCHFHLPVLKGNNRWTYVVFPGADNASRAIHCPLFPLPVPIDSPGESEGTQISKHKAIEPFHPQSMFRLCWDMVAMTLPLGLERQLLRVSFEGTLFKLVSKGNLAFL